MIRPLFLTGENELVRCWLCPHNCAIQNGRFGLCGVRGNKGGVGIIPFYGYITALAMDPIEKKPLYHFKPGSRILSLGFAGCNLRCPFCQNWQISQALATTTGRHGFDMPEEILSGRYMKPGEVISAALNHDSPSIAYTYSEPLVHIEFLLDCMKLARKHGIANVLVTNGCINSGHDDSPAAQILALTDAANIDLKCFSDDSYQKILNGNLQTTMDFIKLSFKMGVHTEITTLVVPDLNNSAEELNDIANFIASVSAEIPWHLTAYHPDYRWNAPPTNRAFLLNAAKKAQDTLKYVHAGNI